MNIVLDNKGKTMIKLDTTERLEDYIEMLLHKRAYIRLKCALKLFPELRDMTDQKVASFINMERETVCRNHTRRNI